MIDLRENKIERLPARFGNLRKLLRLNLDSNNLQQLDTNFADLRSLQDLSLAKNRISHIVEDCLTWLQNLVMLDLHENRLTEFTAVPKSPKLDTLSLSFN